MSTRPKIKVASIINGKYLAFRKLGEGGCGVIYEVALVKCPQRRFACKAETTVADEDPTLPMEHKVISLLNERNSIHTVELLEKGKGDNYTFIVMTLLGPSLDAIRATLPVKKFSTFTTTVILIQALDSLKEVHEIGFIHRDVKPANFAIGALGTPKQRLLHILDFGIARQYLVLKIRVKDKKGEMVMRKPRKIVPFRGTLRYCSAACQERKEQGRQDDLWSLFYMLVEFVKGSLPWTGVSSQDEVLVMKRDQQEIFNGLEDEFVLFGKHIDILRYKTKPDYTLLRDLLLAVFKRRGFNSRMKVDWEKGGRYDSYFEKQTATLPAVTEKDMSEVDLGKLLQIPDTVRTITEKEVLAAKIEEEDEALNTAQDDTISLSVDQAAKSMKKKETESKPRTPGRKYVYKQPSKNNVTEVEKRWKEKMQQELREKMAKRAEAEKRGKRDVIVPEDVTEAKRKAQTPLNKKPSNYKS